MDQRSGLPSKLIPLLTLDKLINGTGLIGLRRVWITACKCELNGEVFGVKRGFHRVINFR